MLDINTGELVIIAVLAVVLVGPERLPQYVQQLATLTRAARGWLGEAKSRVVDELGPDAAAVDWAQLDPRRYDPRAIVREALLDDLLPGGVRRPAGSAEDVAVRQPAGATVLPDAPGAEPGPVTADAGEPRSEAA